MSSLTYMLIALCVVFGDQIHAEENETNAIDFEATNGLQMQFPYYSPDYTTMDDKMREHILADMTETFQFLSTTMADKLDGNGSFFGTGGRLVKMVLAQRDRNKGVFANNPNADIEKNFFKDQAVMFKRLMSVSAQKAKSMSGPQVNAQELKKIVTNLLNAFIEGYNNNPVACFVDYNKGTVNGVQFEEYASDMMANLRFHGFGRLFKCIDFVITKFGWFSG